MKSPRDTTILVVDDDEDTTALLCELLRRRGYRAVALSSASQCLDYLRSEVADVVVTDVQMPGMTGIELCRELQLRHPDLLAIVLTGVADQDNAISALRAGAYDFVVKPAKSDLLEISIKRALKYLALRRQVNRLQPAPATRDDKGPAASGVGLVTSESPRPGSIAPGSRGADGSGAAGLQPGPDDEIIPARATETNIRWPG